MTKLGIFTKAIHVEKIVNFLNQEKPDIDYIISTSKQEINAFKFDVGISYCFPYIVDINYPVKNKRTWYNYHPALLPEFPGLTNYSFAIAKKVNSFGVTLHVITDVVDEGPVIRRKEFTLSSVPTNTNELGSITHYFLFQLFKETIELLLDKPAIGNTNK